MELNTLYDIANKENIKVYDWQIEDTNGMYLNYHAINAIALNYDRLGTYIDEKCTLAHELGHYFSGFTYKVNSSSLITNKAEYKANQWSYVALVPLSKLKKLIKKGFNIYELSDHFEVTVQYMSRCLQFYSNKYGNFMI